MKSASVDLRRNVLLMQVVSVKTRQPTDKGDSWLRDMTNEGRQSEVRLTAQSTKRDSATRCGASSFKSHTSRVLVDIMKNCFGIEYLVVSIPGTGFCGYSCLSYALTDDNRQYSQVVEDLLKAFFNNPQIFVQQTEFGRRIQNLSVYENQMHQDIASIPGHSLSSLYWCEEAHLILIVLLYDFTIFVYDLIHRKWYTSGDNARKGHICLLSSSGHFDVLGRAIWKAPSSTAG